MTMKPRLFSIILFSVLSPAISLYAQVTPPSPATAPPVASISDTPDDAFAGLFKQAEAAKVDYNNAIDSTTAQLKKLAITRRCQSQKVDVAIDGTLKLLDAWYQEAHEYWSQWNTLQNEKTQRIGRYIESFLAQQEEAKKTEDSYDEERANLQKKFDDNGSGTQNPETRKQADKLKELMKLNRDQMEAKVQEYNELEAKIKEYKAVYEILGVKTRENLREVERYYDIEKELWAEKRTEAEKPCSNEKPNTTSGPLPKGGKGQQ